MLLCKISGIRTDKQKTANGRILVVFNTADDIVLTKTQLGCQFGPSVLVPFSKGVTVLGAAGFVDAGWIVAKTLAGREGRQ